jgi:hypothetical protein
VPDVSIAVMAPMEFDMKPRAKRANSQSVSWQKRRLPVGINVSTPVAQWLNRRVSMRRLPKPAGDRSYLQPENVVRRMGRSRLSRRFDIEFLDIAERSDDVRKCVPVEPVAMDVAMRLR